MFGTFMCAILVGQACLTGLVGPLQQLPNVHPDTGVRDKAVPFKVLMKFRSKVDPRLKNQACMGVNGLAAEEGVVKVGEWVHVKKLLSPPEDEE